MSHAIEVDWNINARTNIFFFWEINFLIPPKTWKEVDVWISYLMVFVGQMQSD